MKKVIKYIPNTITILRILLSLILLFLKPFSSLFLIMYSACGFTDMIDGYIARKTNSSSSLGTILDSISDLIFMIAVIMSIIPAIRIPKEILLWILLIALIRIASILTAYFKYNTFAILHTYANKVSGFLLFLFPFFYKFINIYILGFTLCFITGISAIEELTINIISKELSRNIKGIWLIKNTYR